MRLWHKSLISVLPRKQLLAQWRECCAIASNIATKGEPNHLLVNKVLEYSDSDFIAYSMLVRSEMGRRGYIVSKRSERDFQINMYKAAKWFTPYEQVDHGMLYDTWHNDRYFWQCYYNLEEKYDCGGITKEEFDSIRAMAVKKYENSIHGVVIGMEGVKNGK